MNSDLSPQLAEKMFEGEGGSYYSWSSSKFSLLGEAKVGAGKLVLHPRGLAIPHYSDCSKIGFVLQGSCTVGMIFPSTSEEKLLTIDEGDAIAVPSGVVSWWLNGGDSDLVISFIGETSNAHTPGEFTYFFMAGALGVLGGFSTDFISKAYDLNEEEANKLVKSQTGTLIIKLEEGRCIPQPEKGTGSELTFDIENSLPDISVENGGFLWTLTASKFPFLQRLGLGGSVLKLEANATCSPMHEADSGVRVTYVAEGSGRVQIAGFNGKQVLNSKVEAGNLFVVPRFFVSMIVAGGEGMKCVSVITSTQPVIGQLSGNASVWKALSPAVLQTSLGVTPEFADLFISKVTKSKIIVPPKN